MKFIRRLTSRRFLSHLNRYFFTPRFQFNRFEFNLVALFLITFGLLAGSYLTVADIIPQIFAATSWAQSDWSGGQGSSTSNQYSAISDVDTTTAGQVSLSKIEKFSNTGFDSASDLDNWLGVDPKSISGLQVFVKADSGVYTDSGTTLAADGDSVQQWDDQSGNGNNPSAPSASRRPTLKDNQVNGRPALSFGPDVDTAGNSDALDTAVSSISTLSDVTYFVIGSFDYTNQPSGNYDYLFSVYNSASPSTTAVGSIARQAANGSQPDHYYTYYNASAYYGPSLSSGFKLFTQQFSNTSPRHFLWLNRASQTVDSAGSESTISNPKLTLGKWQNGTWALNGRIAEFLMYNSALSSTNRQAVENYLNNKYNLGTSALTIDNSIHHSGAGSAKVVTGADTDEVLQNVNVGDTNTYNLVAYAYTDGSAVSSSDVELYSNGSTVSTTYTSVGSGWYKLSGTVNGANASRTYGVQVQANKTVYLDDFSLYKYQSTGTLTSNIYDTGLLSAWGNLTYTSSGSTASVKVRAGNDADLSDATSWASCSAVTSGSDLSGGCTPDGKRYVQYQITLATSDTLTTPTLSDVTVDYSPYDTTPPSTNASDILMYTASGGRSIASNGWNDAAGPYFSWTAGADNDGGSGLLGYCLYLGTDSSGNPETAKGILGTTPVAVPSGSTCQFIVSSTDVDLATSGYLASSLVSGSTYYLNIKAIDLAGNVYAGSAASFYFRNDTTLPTNVSYLSFPSQNFSNVSDMNFSWPTSGSSASSDSDSGVLGWQYQINSTTGAWQGTTHDTALDLDYIPATASAYTLIPARDSGSIVSGSNVVYLRTVDNAGNTSSGDTYRTGNLDYGGAAPTFPGDGTVTVTPSTATTNSFALSWPAATATDGQTVTHYYYSINNAPPSTLNTLQNNSGTYIDNGTKTVISAAALANVVKGSNTVYVVAIDDADTPNYSPSNKITGNFTLNSTNPDPVQNLNSTDSSIKDKSQWNVTLTWTAPVYQGAGNLTYNVYRSSDGLSFSKVGSTTGLSYVDNTPDSALYYYYIITQDGASAVSANSTTVTITPTGKYTSPPVLQSGPTVSGITTTDATISWSTDRDGDSKISYGTSSGQYGNVDAANTDQVTNHSLTLTNLSPGTTYYYKANWTDTDGNTDSSSEHSFTTTPPPSVSAVKASDISLDSAYINFTISNATKATVEYGKTTSYGGSESVATSSDASTYSVKLSDLTDGTEYHYRIRMEDVSGSIYYSDDYADLITLPRPKIGLIQIDQVSGTAQPTVLVSWTTNTDISSIITYFPIGDAGAAKDNVDVALIHGNHQMLISGLDPKTTYQMIVKGRDKVGNEAVSDTQTFTTATDTRPPYISNLAIQGSAVPSSGSSGQAESSQLVVTWDTDKAATSQVEYGEGTGNSYSQKTQQDGNLTFNHLVIISGLTPSKVYHLKALSVDKYNNTGQSVDTVTITPKSTDNALNLVISNLEQAFGFLGALNTGGGQ